MDMTLVVMAAGLGSRYGGVKQIERLGPDGEILMEYAIYDALRAGFDRIVLIIKPQMLQDVRALFGDRIEQRTGIRIDYAFQTPERFTAAQPELDDQIEALLDYYAGKPWEIDSPGCMTMDSSNADGTGGRTSSFQMHGMILTDRFYRFSLRGISVDTKNPDNVGIWALFLLQVDQPTDYAYCVAGEDDMVGIYVDLPAEQFDYEVTE